MGYLVNNKDLTRKLNYILRELGMNKTQFLAECKKYNPSISKPTVLNMLNGVRSTTPSLMTLQTVVMVCRNSKNEALHQVSFDYLLNDGIQDLEARNTQLFAELGLSDDAVEALKRFNTNFLPLNEIEVINYFLYHTSYKYWYYLGLFQKVSELRMVVKKMDASRSSSTTRNESALILQFEKLIRDEKLDDYMRQYFPELHELLRKKADGKRVDIEQLEELLDVARDALKMKVVELGNKTLDSLEEE